MADKDKSKAAEDDGKQANKPTSPPDRLSTDPTSKYYSEEDLERGVGIKFRGKERTNIQEYSISGGWVKMVMGKTVDRFGRPLTIKSKGPVEAWYRDDDEEPGNASVDAMSDTQDDSSDD